MKQGKAYFPMSPINDTCQPPKMPVHLTAIFMTLSVLGMLISAAGNSLIFLAMYKTRPLRTPANYLLVSMSFASFMLIPVMAAYTLSLTKSEKDPVMPHLCSWSSEMDFAIFCVVMAHLATISLDRLVAIKMPMRYPVLATNKNIAGLIVFLWIMGTLEGAFAKIIQSIDKKRGLILLELLYGCLQSNKIPEEDKVKDVVPHFLALMSLVVFVPSGIMLITHALIFKISLKQYRSIRAVQDAVGQRRLTEIRAAKTVAIIVFSAMACFSPLLAVNFITIFEPPASKRRLDKSQFNVKYILFPSLKILTLWAMCFNPLIYALKSRPFREALKRISENAGISFSKRCNFELKPTAANNNSSSTAA